MPTMQALHHHQVNSRDVPEVRTGKAQAHHGHAISLDAQANIAQRSAEGGRGVCYVCGYHYAMSFMRLVYVNTMRRQEHVCKACQDIVKFTPVD